MRLCLRLPFLLRPAVSAGAGECRQVRPAFFLLFALMLLPLSAQAEAYRLVRVNFSDTFSMHPDAPQFSPPPAPWLIALELPLAEPDPAPPLDSVTLARNFDRHGGRPLVERAESKDPALSAALLRLGAPRGVIGVADSDPLLDQGTTAYLMMISFSLFMTSASIGYFTRQRPAYSESDEWLRESGRPCLPLLLLPPAAPARR